METALKGPSDSGPTYWQRGGTTSCVHRNRNSPGDRCISAFPQRCTTCRRTFLLAGTSQIKKLGFVWGRNTDGTFAINPREARALTAVATATEIFGITCTTFWPKVGGLACELEGLEAVDAPVPVCATFLLLLGPVLLPSPRPSCTPTELHAERLATDSCVRTPKKKVSIKKVAARERRTLLPPRGALGLALPVR
eukprot:1193629-Prorocentrum_minimum.AAC.2